MKLRYSILIMMALFLSLATTSAIAKDKNPHPRPFSGSVIGQAEFPENGNCLDVTGAWWQTLSVAVGELTHMGRSEYFSSHCSTVDGSALAGGEATIVAANGDELWIAYSGTTIAPPPIITISLENIVLGGTGRFEGATGFITGYAFVTFLGLDAPSFPIELTFNGYIIY